MHPSTSCRKSYKESATKYRRGLKSRKNWAKEGSYSSIFTRIKCEYSREPCFRTIIFDMLIFCLFMNYVILSPPCWRNVDRIFAYNLRCGKGTASFPYVALRFRTLPYGVNGALVPNSTTRTPATDTTNGRALITTILQLVVQQIHHQLTNICHIPTSWYVEMLGSGMRCGKFVAELLWLLVRWWCPLMALYTMSLARDRVVEFGPYSTQCHVWRSLNGVNITLHVTRPSADAVTECSVTMTLINYMSQTSVAHFSS